MNSSLTEKSHGVISDHLGSFCFRYAPVERRNHQGVFHQQVDLASEAVFDGLFRW